MELLAGIATLSFVLVAGVIGTRLLLLARRTRELPELSIGLAMLLIVFLGYPLTLLAGLEGASVAVAKGCFTTGTLVTAVGTCFAFVFTRTVFRPHEAWARIGVVLAGAAVLGLAAARIAPVLAPGAPVPTRLDSLTLVALAVNTTGYGWTAVESFRYHAMLRRRQALGLADPVVTNRFLLWAVSGTAACVGILVPITMALLDGGALEGSPVSLTILGVAGLVSSVSTYLAFMPPAAWVRWVAGGAPALPAI